MPASALPTYVPGVAVKSIAVVRDVPDDRRLLSRKEHPKMQRDAARLRYPVLAVRKNRGRRGILMRRGIIAGVKRSIFPRISDPVVWRQCASHSAPVLFRAREYIRNF